MVSKLDAARIATKAEDAYSRDRYTTAGWIGAAKLMAAEGFEPAEIDWVLRSKHMRWAGDAANRNHAVTLANFANYIDHHLTPTAADASGMARLRREAANAINQETRRRSTGAFLAGACEGEDIADLIDFARSVRDETCPSGEPGDGERQLAILRDKATRILSAIERRAK